MSLDTRLNELLEAIDQRHRFDFFSVAAHVEWRPPMMPRLHYEALYRGLPEYVRLAPSVLLRADAVTYLKDLHPWDAWQWNPLQRDRIMWVRMWIAACNDDDENASDAETVSLQSD